MSNQWTQVENPAVTVTLEQPIRAFKDMITELRLREPTAGDVLRAGTPVEYDPRSDPPKMTINESKAFAMLERLSGVPIASLERMTSNDAVRCFWGIARFFLPELLTHPPAQQDSSPESTTALPTSS